jgi:indolepyruvate ferredoxin oxidoreductase
MPEGGLNIRLGDHWIAQEERLLRYKRFAAEAFSHANGMDRRVHGKPGAKIGFVAAGKNWLDLVWALDALGIDEAEAERLGITTYKVGQTWPLDMKGFKDWAEGLELIVVVEEKRKLIEVQVKEAIFDDRRGRRVYGYKDGQGEILFPQHYSLDPGNRAEARPHPDRRGARHRSDPRRHRPGGGGAPRQQRPGTGDAHALFLLRLSAQHLHQGARGRRAGAGIGCHFMAKWMDRSTEAYTHMGGEGANWIGEAPFSTRKHVFQNLGEGTYNHSGILAIRAAVAAKANITYKILFNDAVAMTGGQHNEGDLDPARIAHEVKAMGVENIALSTTRRKRSTGRRYPRDLERHERDDLMPVQEVPGDRRRLRHHLHPDLRRRKAPPPQARHLPRYRQARLHQHRCLRGLRRLRRAVELRLHRAGGDRAGPQARHRPVHLQQGFLLPQGLLPLLRDGRGRRPKKEATAEVDLSGLPEPALPQIDGTHNIVITGVGGTGVVTIGATSPWPPISTARAPAMMEMAGLAQKGGAVHIHAASPNGPRTSARSAWPRAMRRADRRRSGGLRRAPRRWA